MLNSSKIAIAQMKILSGRPDFNLETMLKFINEAKNQNADIIIFPALSITGRTKATMTNTLLKDYASYKKDIINASSGIKVCFNDSSRQNMKLTNFGFDVQVISDNAHFVLGENRNIEQSNIPAFYVNAVGLDDCGKTIYTLDGRSKVLNSDGKVVFQANAYEEGLYCIELDKVDSMPVINEPNESEAAQIYNAIYYGVKEFMSQIGMKKIVIGISGGIDSAVDAALYTKILGAENVLLVNMPSVFNSVTTRGLSEQLAHNLGCNYMVVPIQESVDHTINQIESTPMTFLTDGSTQQIKLSSFVRENIQARDRSARVLATLAAAFGGGFTCNANKAETTVGYATMYGDSAGVVSALADLWKYQVYELAHYLNDVVYGREVIPQGIIDIVPSAELSTAQNVDEGKGDPLKYPYHDYLLRSFVEYNQLPEDILNYYADGRLEDEIGCERGLVKKYFSTDADFIADLERWWNMFTGIAVAKRIQSPPIIAVSQRPFGSDFKEAQHGSHYTKAYKELKAKLLSK